MDDTWAKQLKKYRYKSDLITVWWDGALCNHNGNCMRQLPDVFDVNKPRWIDVYAGATADIARVCDECPTGSLSYDIAKVPNEDQA
jgi:uncharacterized Fe-S cluster protein YjdI